MGYDTMFYIELYELIDGKKMRISDPALEEEILSSKIDDYYTLKTFTEDVRRWYEWEQDVLALSRLPLCANIIFEIRGEGEESGDMWEATICNGKSTGAREATMVIPPTPDDFFDGIYFNDADTRRKKAKQDAEDRAKKAELERLKAEQEAIAQQIANLSL